MTTGRVGSVYGEALVEGAYSPAPPVKSRVGSVYVEALVEHGYDPPPPVESRVGTFYAEALVGPPANPRVRAISRGDAPARVIKHGSRATAPARVRTYQ